MAEQTNRTAAQIRKTVSELKQLLADIDPSADVVARGSLDYAELGMQIVFGPGVGNCSGCFGCAGCDGGCMGCKGTSTVAGQYPGSDVINPNPAAGR